MLSAGPKHIALSTLCWVGSVFTHSVRGDTLLSKHAVRKTAGNPAQNAQDRLIHSTWASALTPQTKDLKGATMLNAWLAPPRRT